MKYLEVFKELVSKSKNIVVSTHIFPDADGIGSEIALAMALRKMGKKAICVNEEPLMERYKYLDPDDVLISYEDFLNHPQNKEIDLFIVADTNAMRRIGSRVQRLAQNSKEVLFIDHHPAPKEIQALHCIDTKMAATGELVGCLLEHVGVELDQKIALPLYTAILIDTSSFRYPTVTANTHRIISKLLAAGVKPPRAFNKINGTKKISYMQLLGIVLSSAQNTADEAIAWLCVTEDILNKFEVDNEDTHGFVNHLLVLDNIKVACMFWEQGKNVKISLRSTGVIDVGVMAEALGGGGHNHSAATIVEGKLEDVIPSTIKKIQVMLGEA